MPLLVKHFLSMNKQPNRDIDYFQAKTIAQTYVDQQNIVDDRAIILEEVTIHKHYGWVFFYQSERFLKTDNFSDMLVGNAPILVMKANGDVIVLGPTADTTEELIERFEKDRGLGE